MSASRNQAIQNLKKKGAEANPNGPPVKFFTFQEILRRKLEKQRGKASRAEGLVEKLLEKAEAGDFKSIESVIDRIDGKPQQSVELGNKDDKPFYVELPRKMVTTS